MEFKEVIERRYSCRKFDGRKIERAQLEAILEAGRIAPTVKNLQEQRIYVIESEQALEAVDRLTPCRYGAPTVLAVAYDKNSVFTYPGGRVNSGAEDATIVATHMILAAANEGVDSVWLNFFDPDIAAKELGLPENEEIVMMMPLGFAAEGAGPSPQHASKKELAETVKYI